MANEAEKAASEHRMVDVYQTTKKLYRQKRNLGMSVRDTQGTMIISINLRKSKIKEGKNTLWRY